ncbi:MAG: hypothetical protein R3C44_14460 [Chloroflexota bacterium]
MAVQSPDRFGRVSVIAVSLILLMPFQWLLLHTTGLLQITGILQEAPDA